MGTTDTLLQTGSGQFGYVLAIEGYEYLITDVANTAAVVTAWAGTGWTQALPGLKVIGGIRQSIEPFKDELDKPRLTFHVLDCDGNDTFGKAVWKSKPSISSRLNAVFAPAADGSGTLTVRDNNNFPASGYVSLGVQRVAYSSKSGSTGLVVGAAGANVYAPFSADGSNTFSRPGQLAEGQNFDVAAPPRVGDVHAHWDGKMVSLYIHRIVGGVWDTRAQAHLEFAGTITDIADGEGITVVNCVDLRKRMEDAVLHRRQWVGQIKQGIQLRAGDKFRVSYFEAPSSISISSTLTVVASGASGSDEVNAGRYDYEEFLSILEAWVKAIAFDGTWSFYVKQREQGMRTIIRVLFGSSAIRRVSFHANSTHPLEFMGFAEQEMTDEEGDWFRVDASDKDDEFFITSPQPPYRAKALQRRRNGTVAKLTVDCDYKDGVWFDHGTYLPKGIQGVTDGEDWSYVMIGDRQLAVAEYSSDTRLVNVTPLVGFGEIYPDKGEDFEAPGTTYDQPAEAPLEIRQLIYLTGRFSDIVPKLLASIGGGGTAGVNHATHDVFPFGAAIPWSLLGDTFVNSCKSLEATGGTDTIAVRIARPTLLKDVLLPELALRFAFLVFKDGVYQLVQPNPPNALSADHTLDETNKAVGPGARVPMSACEWTSDYLTNVVKINYKSDYDGKFVGHPITIKDEVSIAAHGESQAITVDAVNSVSEVSSLSGSTVEELTGKLITHVFPMFGRPVKIVRRTIAPSLYDVAPGDTCSLSDDLLRDTTTGERGLENRAGTILSVFHDYGHEGGSLAGEVSILISDEDKTYPLSPAAEIDTTYTTGLYTNGYDSTNFRLKLKDHAFSGSSASTDVNHFDHGDLIRIVELDPADPTAPDAWSRTLHASTGVDTATGYLQMTASLSSPAYSGSTKKYAIVAQQYTSVQASQKLHAFQADDADGLVQDAAEPNLYGSQKKISFAAGAATDLPALLATELYGDGKPLTPFHLQYLTRAVNNFISYKTAPHSPMLPFNTAFTDSTSYQLVWILPFEVGGFQTAGRTRYISVAPMFRSTTGATVYVKVTSSRYAPTGTSLTDYSFAGPSRSVEFTTTSTTHAVATAQDLLPVPSFIPGHTFLSVQMKATAPAECRSEGLSILRMKPIS